MSHVYKQVECDTCMQTLHASQDESLVMRVSSVRVRSTVSKHTFYVQTFLPKEVQAILGKPSNNCLHIFKSIVINK